MKIRLWVVEIETALGRFKKGVAAPTDQDAVDEVARLQQTTNKLDIAYCPSGKIVAVYERPKNKPMPPAAVAAFQATLAR